jgi:hypothetical protein
MLSAETSCSKERLEADVDTQRGLRCGACADHEASPGTVVVCYLTAGSWRLVGPDDEYEEPLDEALVTSVVALCPLHRDEILGPVERLSRQVDFSLKRDRVRG